MLTTVNANITPCIVLTYCMYCSGLMLRSYTTSDMDNKLSLITIVLQGEGGLNLKF